MQTPLCLGSIASDKLGVLFSVEISFSLWILVIIQIKYLLCKICMVLDGARLGCSLDLIFSFTPSDLVGVVTIELDGARRVLTCPYRFFFTPSDLVGGVAVCQWQDRALHSKHLDYSLQFGQVWRRVAVWSIISQTVLQKSVTINHLAKVLNIFANICELERGNWTRFASGTKWLTCLQPTCWILENSYLSLYADHIPEFHHTLKSVGSLYSLFVNFIKYY